MSKREVLVVIPARGGSKRLKRKNIQPVLGVPMVVWTRNRLKPSRHVTRVVVSTEDDEIKKICRENQIEVVDRPESLATDQAPKQDAIVHATQTLHEREGYQPEIVISLQANSPEIAAKELDAAIDFFLEKVYPGAPIKEVWAIGRDMIQNGAFRIMTWQTVFQKTLSTYTGVFMTDYLDVHTAEDMAELEQRLSRETGDAR